MKEDITWLLVTYATRGTKMNKILAKTGKDGVAKLKALKSQYNIVDKAHTNKVMMIGRIATAFPAPTVELFVTHGLATPIILPQDASGALKCPVLASVIPKEDKGNIIFMAHLYHQLRFDGTINAKAYSLENCPGAERTHAEKVIIFMRIQRIPINSAL